MKENEMTREEYILELQDIIASQEELIQTLREQVEFTKKCLEFFALRNTDRFNQEKLMDRNL